MLDNNSESERKFTIYSVYQNNEKWCCREPHGLVVVVARLPETEYADDVSDEGEQVCCS